MSISTQRLNDRFLLHTCLSTHQRLQTWSGTDIQRDKSCLLRHFSCPANQETAYLAVFTKELLHWQQAYHPQVTKLLEMFLGPENHSGIWLAVDQPDGCSLSTAIVEWGLFSEPQVRHLLLELGRVLAFLHRQHPPFLLPDINPAHIWLNAAKKPTILHFGPLSDSLWGATDTNQLLDYSAPERLQNKPVPASDLFSLGRCAVFLLANKRPTQFQIQDLNISEDFANILNRLTATNPDERWANAVALQRALQLPPVPTPKPTPSQSKPAVTASPQGGVMAAINGFIAQHNISLKRVFGLAGAGLLLWYGSGYLWAAAPPPTITDPGQIFVTPQPLPTEAVTVSNSAEPPVTPVNRKPVPVSSPAAALAGMLEINLMKDFAHIEQEPPPELPKKDTPVADLTATPQETLTGLPTFQTVSPQYGFFEIAWDGDRQIGFVMDGEQLYVDSNNDESLANETALTPVNGIYMITIQIPLQSEKKTEGNQASVSETQPLKLAYDIAKKHVMASGHYTGTIKIGERTMPALTFVSDPTKGLWQDSGLWLDLDNNGKWEHQERVEHKGVIEVDGQSYILHIVAP